MDNFIGDTSSVFRHLQKMSLQTPLPLSLSLLSISYLIVVVYSISYTSFRDEISHIPSSHPSFGTPLSINDEFPHLSVSLYFSLLIDIYDAKQ